MFCSRPARLKLARQPIIAMTAKIAKSYLRSCLIFLTLAALIQCVDYGKCVIYLQLQKGDCSFEDPDVLCPKSAGGNPRFTLFGCLKHCGDGIQLDTLSGIVGRFVLWLLPVLVLGAHFQFPALGWRNTMSVCAGLLGDPIRSLRCMMARLELFRRIARKCVDAGYEDGDIAADVASVCAACDELGFNDLWTYRCRSEPSSKERNGLEGERTS